MHVVATAGHVDHGKSTLVRALTGMEPDRWAEERAHGMTIDLGFAWTALPSGQVLGFVDVPGHARFLGNMLAGLGPAPAVLFVVAADEGWRQQSTEHLAAVDALGIRHGLVAVTRSDLADPAPALADAQARLAASSLGTVEAVTVSGATSAGVPELATALDRLVGSLPAPDASARVRLWVDRAFTIRGSGTVVTGTLAAGTLRVGDELELRGQHVRVRGLQSMGTVRDEVAAVARVAVNLRGVDRADVGRGDALLTPGAWRYVDQLDVRLTATDHFSALGDAFEPRARPPALRSEIRGGLPREMTLHVGSAAVPVRVRLLGGDVVRLQLARPLPLQAADRALLRAPGVLSGVQVLDADPPELRRRGAAAARAAALHVAPDLRAQVARRGAVRAADLAALGVAVVRTEGVRVVGPWLVAAERWQEWVTALRDAVDAHAAAEPLDGGLPEPVAGRRLALPDRALLGELVSGAGLEQHDGRVRRPGAGPRLGPGVDVLEERLVAAPFAAPEQPDLDALGLGRREVAAAVTTGRLIQLGGGVLLLPDGPARALSVLSELPEPFTAGDARQALGTTRRVAIPLLEHLDARGWTRRVDGALREVVR